MTHDLMCAQRECDACAWEGEGCCRGDCQCAFIAKVRADERRQAVERVRVKKGKFPSTRLDWDTIVIAILDGTKLRLSKKELNEKA